MKLSVVIVSYNVKFYLEQCLVSLFRSMEGMDAEVFVVDNHSSDHSVAYLGERFPTVKFMANRHNLGFARANNMAIRQCQGEYVLLLNPDTILGESTMREVVGFMDGHPEGGAIGVRMLNSHGVSARESRRGVPSPMVAFFRMTGLCLRFPMHRKLGHYYMGYLDWEHPHEIEVVSGAFCLLRHRAIKEVGLLDEDFFMYGEDIDLSYRLLKGGFRNYYFPSLILHYKGESTEKSSFRYVHVFYQAMLIFFRKHYHSMSFLFYFPVKVAIYAKAFVAFLGILAKQVRKSLGFFPLRRQANERYVFIGSEEMVSECRNLAKGMSLEATYIVGVEKDMPRGHLDDRVGKWMDGHKTYVVYDVESFRFDTIFSLFSSSASSLIELATYNMKTHRLITVKDVF